MTDRRKLAPAMTEDNTRHQWHLVELPDDGLGRERHYMMRADCICGGASRDYRYWGQARNAAVKHAGAHNEAQSWP